MLNVLKVSLQTTIYTLHDRAISPPGVEGSIASKRVISTRSKNPGRKSQCEPRAEVIMAKIETGLSAQRTYQDLTESHGLSNSYQLAKTFLRNRASPAAEPDLAVGMSNRRGSASGFSSWGWLVCCLLVSLSTQDWKTLVEIFQFRRRFSALFRKWAAPLWGLSALSQPRQYEVGGAQGRLV